MATSPPASSSDAPRPTSVLDRGVQRALASREEALRGEVNQIIEATYTVISRTESLDPPLREILCEAGLSTPAFYRHFRAKDELLMGLLEQGWATLRSYLAHQMAKSTEPAEQVSSWVRGMLAQAAEEEAAHRARPFVVNLHRLATLFPSELRASRDSLVALLVEPIARLCDEDDPWPDAMAVYDLVKSAQERHLVARTAPDAVEVRHIVAFVLAGVGQPPVA